jgi:hypothetical protein
VRKRRPESHDFQQDLELIMHTLMRMSERLDRIERLLKDEDGEEEDEDDTGANG